jgi:hypothetical protein
MTKAAAEAQIIANYSRAASQARAAAAAIQERIKNEEDSSVFHSPSRPVSLYNVLRSSSAAIDAMKITAIDSLSPVPPISTPPADSASQTRSKTLSADASAAAVSQACAHVSNVEFSSTESLRHLWAHNVF